MSGPAAAAGRSPSGGVVVVGAGWVGRWLLSSVPQSALRGDGQRTAAHGLDVLAVLDRLDPWCGGEHALPGVVLGAGDPRRRWADVVALPAEARLLTVVDGHASVAEPSEIGAGSWIGPYAHLAGLARTGVGCVVGPAASIGHDAVVGDGVVVEPGAAVSGNCCVGRLAHIGAGAAIVEGVTIGDGATVAPGAVVLRDVRPGVRVAGVPAREVGPAGPLPTALPRWTPGRTGAALVGPGTVIGACTALGPDVVIGGHAHLEQCVVGPGAQLGDGVRIRARAVVGCGAHVGARVVVGLGAVVGAASHIAAGVTIGPGVVIDPGATVTGDMPCGTVTAGRT